MAEQRPNIILLITDQQRYDTIRALGFDYMETPNLDRLVREGVVFSNCHVAAASATPSDDAVVPADRLPGAASAV